MLKCIALFSFLHSFCLFIVSLDVDLAELEDIQSMLPGCYQMKVKLRNYQVLNQMISKCILTKTGDM